MEGVKTFEIESKKKDLLQIPEEIEINFNEEKTKLSKTLCYSFFLFVNPTSGGNRAASLIKLGVEKFEFSAFRPNDSEVILHIYDLLDKTSRERGFNTLKKEQEEGKQNIRVIVGGGDGTVLWVIEELIKVQADFTKCPIGVIPFGTGNDFSRVLGWGGAEPSVLIGHHLVGLKSLVKKWTSALIEDFDIWDVEIETYEYGGVKKIYKREGKYTKDFITEVDPETKSINRISSLKKKMCNYLSFGLDSRIGLGFDKRRTQSRCGNKLVYCLEGLKKIFLRTPKVNDVLEVVHYETLSEPERSTVHDPTTQQVDEITGENFTLYPSNGSQQFQGKADTKITVIKGNPAIFLCLNIPSYMGGASDPWGTSKGKVGVINSEKGIIPDFDDQRFGDDKLEILGFTGSLSLAMERFTHGQGWRLGQVKGPFKIAFKQSQDPEKPIHTYMQIDGEFYDVIAPRSVRVSLSQDIGRGKIKVMVNSESRK